MKTEPGPSFRPDALLGTLNIGVLLEGAMITSSRSFDALQHHLQSIRFLMLSLSSEHAQAKTATREIPPQSVF